MSAEGKRQLANEIKVVAVFGSSRREENSDLYREAYDLGRALAQAGYTVLNGGYGGSMAAVSRGAAEAGGHVIGVTCAVFDPLTANPWVNEETKMPDMLARLRTIIERSEAYVAVQGGIGTLAEVTLAWSMLQTRAFMKPMILLGANWRHVVDAFREYTDLGNSIAGLVEIADTPIEVLQSLAAPRQPSAPLPRPLG